MPELAGGTVGKARASRGGGRTEAPENVLGFISVLMLLVFLDFGRAPCGPLLGFSLAPYVIGV